jgi:Ser/Thr protein kinase RdoA (MazF antagonist)
VRIDHVQLADVLAEYDLVGARAVPIRTTNNTVYEVTADGFHGVLRVHRPEYRTAAHVRSELKFLSADAETGVRVPEPVPTRDGAVVVDGETVCDLLTWVDGEVLRPGRGLGIEATRALGDALGRIHAVAEAFVAPEALELPRWDGETMFTGIRDDLLDDAQRTTLSTVVGQTNETLDALQREGSPYGPLHFDFILGNCHLARRGGRWSAGVIDFDDLGWGHLLYDLAPLLGNLVEFPGYRARRRAFLDGYRGVRALPEASERHLPVLMAARHAASCAWLFEIHRTTGDGPPIDRHLAYRFDEMRRCLAL